MPISCSTGLSSMALTPVLGASVVTTAFARGHQRAQRDASHLSVGNLTGRDADHHFVEKHESLVDAAQRNQRQSLVRRRAQFQCAILELRCYTECQFGPLQKRGRGM